jgi:hypothetical protein
MVLSVPYDTLRIKLIMNALHGELDRPFYS